MTPHLCHSNFHWTRSLMLGSAQA